MDLPVYHGSISRHTCEVLLSRKGRKGAYLIRDSETIQGALCLCVYKNKVVYTYRILQNHSGYYTIQTSGTKERFFKTMEDLIKNYKKKNQGLATHLQHPVRREGECVYQNIQDETPDYEDVANSSEYVEVLPSRLG